MKCFKSSLIILLLVSCAFSACTNKGPDRQTTGLPDSIEVSPDSIEVSPDSIDNKIVNTPSFFNDIGKTLRELKNEYPRARFIVSLAGFPDTASACFGEEEGEYTYYFFSGQSGDFEKAMNECEEQLRCAGFITTASILFPKMEDDMTFSDFFSSIGVSDYIYNVEDDAITAEGWLEFEYNDMEVYLNTNDVNAVGGWKFTGDERVKSSAPVSIVDIEIYLHNQELADTVMFK